MHILITLSHLYLPEHDHLSGIFERNQAEALRDHGLRVGVFSPGIISLGYLFKKFRYPYLSEDDGIPVLRKWERSFFLNRSFLGEIRTKKYLKMGIDLFDDYVSRYGKPDIIHAHNAINAGYLAYTIKKLYGIPYVITEHNSSYERGLYGRFELNRTNKAYQSADKIIAVSSALKNTIHKHFGRHLDCVVVPNTIDKIYHHAYRQGLKPADGPFTFLTVGSLDKNKNQADLIVAFSKFAASNNARLIIVGSGSTESELRDLTRELNLINRVEFLGTLSSEQVMAEMQKAHAFVLSSMVETFGVVLTEALACGCVLVSTKCGGPEDIITEENGLLVPVKDSTSLYQAMMKVYENYKSYNLSEISSSCIQKYSNESVAESLSDLYEQLLESGNSRDSR